MACHVCRAPGPKFCLGCRRRYGGQSVMVAPRRRVASARPASRRRRKAPAAASPRAPLSKQAFLRRMRLGRLKAARARARGSK